jgi:hypothetical protein
MTRQNPFRRESWPVIAYAAVVAAVAVVSLSGPEFIPVSLYLWPLLGPLAFVLFVVVLSSSFALPGPLAVALVLASAVGVTLLNAAALRKLVSGLARLVLRRSESKLSTALLLLLGIGYVTISVVAAGAAVDFGGNSSTSIWPMQSAILGPPGVVQLALADPVGAGHFGPARLSAGMAIACYVATAFIAVINCVALYALARRRVHASTRSTSCHALEQAR